MRRRPQSSPMGGEILSSVVASQIDIHRKYGGVVPELASREHLRQIVPVVREALSQAGMKLRRGGCDWRDAGAGACGSAACGNYVCKNLGGGAGQASGLGESSGGTCSRRFFGGSQSWARAEIAGGLLDCLGWAHGFV